MVRPRQPKRITRCVECDRPFPDNYRSDAKYCRDEPGRPSCRTSYARRLREHARAVVGNPAPVQEIGQAEFYRERLRLAERASLEGATR